MQYTRLDRVRVTRFERRGDGWLLSFCSADRAAFDTAVALLRELPQAWRVYLPKMRAWWLARIPPWLTDAWPSLAEALATVLAEDARRRSEHAYQRRERKSSSSSSSSHERAPAADVAAAFATLCLTPAAPPELVSAARRVWAKHYHPDHGGDAARMVAANNAADVALAYAEQRH